MDLSGAALETYVEGSGQDEHHPTVANLESVLFNGGADWLVPVFGASVVVLAAEPITGQPWIELGAGRTADAPFEHGDPIELAAGLQVSLHLDVAVCFDGFGPHRAPLVYAARSEGSDAQESRQSVGTTGTSYT